MNDKLGPKNYAKFDRTYMAFGSIMNGLGNSGIMNEKNWDDKAVQAWALAKKLTSDLVDELYKENGTNDEKPL